MSLFSSIVGGFTQLRADAGSMGFGPLDDFWYGPVGGSSASGMRISPESVKRIAAVYACVDRIAKSMIIMPAKVFSQSGSSKTEFPSHPIAKLLRQPNNYQTAADFWQQMTWWQELRGNAFAEIVPGPRGAISELLPMHPDRVTVNRLGTGRLQYKYNDPLTNGTRTLVQDEVFHLRNQSDNGATGESTIALGAEVFGVAMGAQDYSARFMANDAKPSGVIEGANFRSQEDEDKFKEGLQRAQTGANRHKTMILPAGITYRPISITPEQGQLLEARKFSRIEICSMFGVPPHLIGETEKTATYASVEQFNIMFAVQCLLPRVIIWEQTIARDLLMDDRYFVKFSMAALLRGDTAARYQAYQTAIMNGWMNQDEARALEDLNPIPDGSGQTYWRPAQWAPLAQLETPSAPGVTTGDEEDPDSDAEDTGSDPADPGPSNAQLGRLKLLASSAADRCVRKEIAAVAKLRERNASYTEILGFYKEHTDFVAEVLNISTETARRYISPRCRQAVNGEPIDSQSGILLLTDLAIGVH